MIVNGENQAFLLTLNGIIMKRLFTFCFLIVVAGATTMAQWSYIQDDPAIQAQANNMAEDASGNIIAVGGAFGYPLLGDGPPRVTKLDASGNLIWEVELSVPAGIGSISASGVSVVDDGYIIFCGGFEKPLIYKLDPDGAEVWNTELWCSPLALGIATDVRGCVLDDGTIAMFGLDSSVPTNIKIFIVNEDGELISEVTHSTTLDEVYIISAWDLASQGDGFVVTGGGLDATSTWMPYAVKFDAAGEVVWESLFPEYAGLEAYGVCATSDGGYALSAYNFFGGSTAMIKMDGDGNFEWGNTYAATDPGFVAYAYDIAQLADGSYAMLHVNLDTWYLFYGDIEVLLIDETGTETDRITAAAGLSNRANKMIATADGGYAFCGNFTINDYLDPAYDQVYMVQKSSAAGALVDCVYNCVWPGDANNDGLANTDDILAIGVAAGSSGPERDDMSIDWYPHAALSWSDSLAAGDDLKYVDCNGNGTINDDDTAAVALNYSAEHPIYALRTEAGEIELAIDLPETTLTPGYYTFPVLLGDAVNYPDAIYGIRFTVTYEGNDLDLSSVNFLFDDNWFGTAADEIRFRRNDTDLQQLDVALVRKDQNNTSGYGEIGELGFVVIDNIAGRSRSETIVFQITDVRAIDVDMNEINVNGSVAVVDSEGPTGISLQEDVLVRLYPNPVKGSSVMLDLHGLDLPELVTISDLTGRVVSVQQPDSPMLDISMLLAGAYQIQLNWLNNTYMTNLVIE